MVYFVIEDGSSNEWASDNTEDDNDYEARNFDEDHSVPCCNEDGEDADAEDEVHEGSTGDEVLPKAEIDVEAIDKKRNFAMQIKIPEIHEKTILSTNKDLAALKFQSGTIAFAEKGTPQFAKATGNVDTSRPVPMSLPRVADLLKT